MRIQTFVRVLCGSLCFWFHSLAHAQYPDKPIRFLLGFAAGGPTDLSTRALAAAGARILGQPMVVQKGSPHCTQRSAWRATLRSL